MQYFKERSYTHYQYSTLTFVARPLQVSARADGIISSRLARVPSCFVSQLERAYFTTKKACQLGPESRWRCFYCTAGHVRWVNDVGCLSSGQLSAMQSQDKKSELLPTTYSDSLTVEGLIC